MSSPEGASSSSAKAEAFANFARPPAAVFRALGSKESRQLKEDLSTQVENIIASFVAEEAVPCYAVSVVRENEVVFSSGKSTLPFLLDRSISEIFICFAILNRLNEQVDISFDDPIEKFLPSFPDVDPEGSPHITLREFREIQPGNGFREDRQGKLKAEEDDDKLGLLEQIRSDFRSNMSETAQKQPALDLERPPFPAMGFAFLSQALADSSLPQNLWQDFVQEEFLKDVGMIDTGTDLNGICSKRSDKELTGLTEYSDIRSAELADGGWFSTASDLAKCLIHVLKFHSPIRWDSSSRQWSVCWTILGRTPGRSEIGLTWEQELFTTVDGLDEHVITKGGNSSGFLSFIGLHPRTKLGVSVLFFAKEAAVTSAKALGNHILHALLPPICRSVDSHYSGFYLCEPTPPLVRKFKDGHHSDTVEVLEGEVQVTSSPALGLQAYLNLSLCINGKQSRSQGHFLLVTSRAPSEGSTSRWRLLDMSDHPEFAENGTWTNSPRSPRHGRRSLHGLTFEFELDGNTESDNRAIQPTPGRVVCRKTLQS